MLLAARASQWPLAAVRSPESGHPDVLRALTLRGLALGTPSLL